MERFRHLEGVTTLQFLAEKCVGCGLCAAVCPHAVFAVAEGKAQVVDRDGCMECGACARNCPVQALAVNAGVGCASAIIKSWVTGGEPTCGCDTSGCC